MSIVLLPILIPLVTAVICQLGRQRPVWQRAASVTGAAGLMASALWLAALVLNDRIIITQIAGWPAPAGITIVADLFSAMMVVLAALAGLLALVYSLGTIDRRRERFSYHSLTHLLLAGVCGAFLAGDVFNLYVWFEVMLIASFVLLTLGGESRQLEGGLKYLAMNLVASALLLAAIGILYGATGTLNFADLVRTIPDLLDPSRQRVVAMLFLVAFGIKAGIFPLFFWLPSSYHTPHPAVSALFAAVLTKVGVYALIRIFTLLFQPEAIGAQALLLVLAGFTMATGVLGAFAQTNLRRLLSFHIISQIGYLLTGLAIGTPIALAATLFFMAHVVLAKMALFLAGGAILRLHRTEQLDSLGGAVEARPALAMLFFIPAMSLAGMPPLSGFFAKVSIIRAGLDRDQHAIVAVALAVGVMTLFSMLKIWTKAFWEPAPEAQNKSRSGGREWLMMTPMFVLAALMVAMGLAAGPLFTYADRAAAQLLDPAEYMRAVLEASP